MIICKKCNKKVEAMSAKLLVIHHSYQMDVTCHGETVRGNVSIQEMRAGEAKEMEIAMEGGELKKRWLIDQKNSVTTKKPKTKAVK